MDISHTMKMTLHMDEALVKGVMESTGARTKTEAIHLALTEMNRRRRLNDILTKDDFGLDAKGWANAFDPDWPGFWTGAASCSPWPTS